MNEVLHDHYQPSVGPKERRQEESARGVEFQRCEQTDTGKPRVIFELRAGEERHIPDVSLFLEDDGFQYPLAPFPAYETTVNDSLADQLSLGNRHLNSDFCPSLYPQLSHHAPFDWKFLGKDPAFNPSPSLRNHCPSLSSGSTVSSRNSSTRSTRSSRFSSLDEREYDESHEKCQCPHLDCGRVFRDLKGHLLTHNTDRPEKCPIKTCEYHVKGFARAYDRLRHTCTHFKGSMVCGFCPGSGNATENSFHRLDVFSRHLTNVHGVKQLSLSSLKELYHTDVIETPRRMSEGQPSAACTLCLEKFDPQGMYEHLPACVLRRVMGDTAIKILEATPEIVDSSEGSLRNDSVITTIEEKTETLAPDTPEQSPLSVPDKQHTCHVCDKRFKLGGGLRAHLRSHTMTEREIAWQNKSEGSVEAGIDDSVSLAESHLSYAQEESTQEADEKSKADETTLVDRTVPSRCPSPTTSNEINSSDEDTDWTEDTSPASPGSETDGLGVQPVLSPIKRQLVDEIMREFHRLYDRKPSSSPTEPAPQIRTCKGGTGYSSSPGGAGHSSSRGSSSGDSPFSRKRSMNRRGSPPPNGDENGDDPNKRRRPDSKSSGREPTPERRFACPYYKRNPGRHQTFTSCRDPGFMTVARLKEHLYRRHLLPIQCNRCCSTFPNEPSLRDHQRDPRGCEVKEHILLEGFDKDQERKLKSKKRSLVYQTEEDKWKGVYRILFPDDNEEDMPSPYIDYQPSSSTLSGETSNIAHFQAFSRLELPRLVRRTLEVVVEKEAQPLEEKLKDRLVDIVKECQGQLFTMFQGANTETGVQEQPAPAPAPKLTSQRLDTTAEPPLSNLDPFSIPSLPQQDMATLEPCHSNDRKGSTSTEGLSGSPDSGYGSIGTVSFAQDMSFDFPLYSDDDFVDLGGYCGLDENRKFNLDDPSLWSFVDPALTPGLGGVGGVI